MRPGQDSVPVKALGTSEAWEQLQAEPAEGFLLPPTNAALDSSITYLLSPFLHPFTI